MQSADVRISPGDAERDSEASYSRRRLRQPYAVLGRCLEKARVTAIGGGSEHAVTCAVGVEGYVGGRKNGILRFGPEGDSVRRGRIFVGPFHCVARTNRDDRWRHAGRVGVHYSDRYAERGLFQRLMDRLLSIAPGQTSFQPMLATPLRS